MTAPLTERYRPATWQDVVGQDKAVATMLALRDRCGLAGRAYWISGQSGTGKTTLARLIAAEIADDLFVEELDAQDATATRLREIEQGNRLRSWGKGGRCLILNEAHGLRKDAIRQLLVMLERIPSHVAWVFTTTTDGQQSMFDDCDDASPLLSRCLRLDLARRDLAKAFAARAAQIAEAEGLNGRPIADYVRLAQDCRNNLRSMINEIEAGRMLAKRG